MNIRPFSISDLPACAEIVTKIWGEECAKEVFADCYPTADYDFVERFVAEINGIVVGLCGLYRLKAHPVNFIGIDWFVVSPRHQGKGIGTALLLEALNRAGSRTVFVWTSEAIGFYAKHGFVISNYSLNPKESEILMLKSFAKEVAA